MASFNKFHCFVENLAEKVHNLGSDTLRVYLTNATPSASADLIKTNLAEIATGNGYTGPSTVTITTSSQTSGTYSLVGNDLSPMLTATGNVAAFRYAVLYNDTPTSPVDPLIGWWDYGSTINLVNGDTFTVDFGATILTIV